MARIIRFAPVMKERTARHSDVECGYATVSYEGRPALIIETYGSKERESEPKTSQSLLIDESTGRELVRLINSVPARIARVEK